MRRGEESRLFEYRLPLFVGSVLISKLDIKMCKGRFDHENKLTLLKDCLKCRPSMLNKEGIKIYAQVLPPFDKPHY